MRVSVLVVLFAVPLAVPLAACSSAPSGSQLRAEGYSRLAQATALADDARRADQMATIAAYVPPTSTPIPTPTLVPTMVPTATPEPTSTLAPTSTPKVITEIVVVTAAPVPTAAPLFTRDEQRRFVLTGVLVAVLLLVGLGMIGLVLFATRKAFGSRVFFLPNQPTGPNGPSKTGLNNKRRSKKP